MINEWFKIKRIEWVVLILLAIGGALSWYHFSFPRYKSIDLSVNQPKAVEIAKAFLKEQRKVDIESYKVAAMFDVDEAADRYLQRTLGNEDYQVLIQRLQYDLFSWVVRFFKEKQKEEYKVWISSATGEVIRFNHFIEDTASRPEVTQEEARLAAIDFLKTTFARNPDQYIIHSENIKKYDNRQEYVFSWRDKAIDVPWNKTQEKGSAKLLTNVTVTGQEIREFTKSQFEIPEGFNRYVDSLKQTGQNLTLMFRVFYLALITLAIVVVVNRKNQVVSRTVKPFYVGLAVVIFGLIILDVFNSYQVILFGYPTTQSLGDYIISRVIESIIGPFFIALAFVLPAMAGESIRHEIDADKKQRAFLTPLLSSFLSKPIASQVLMGYLVAAIVLGAQALIFHVGFKYWGVWDELAWLTQASTSLVPAFTAMVIGFQASLTEEAMFRLFAINLLKKYGIPAILAVVLAAAMWGFGHTGYEIFPMWFRGVEVTCIGIILGIFYLRFGILCVIVAHFLIDAFLIGLPYLLNPAIVFDFYTALAVLGLPLVLVLTALIFNRKSEEKALSLHFNEQQQFNYNLLKELYSSKTPQQRMLLKEELRRHGWDPAIVERLEKSGE